METKRLIQTIIFLLIGISTFAQIDTLSKKESLLENNKINNSFLKSSNDDGVLSESEAYKLLYLNVKEANDKLISTTQWVIGIALTFLLALVGSQIFFNWRINKKEIDYINKNIDEKMLKQQTDLISVIKSNIKESESQLKEEIKESFESRIKYFSLKSDAIERRLENKISSLNIEVEKNSGDLWKLKGVESNALSSYLKTAELQIELKREVKYILDDIISILNELSEIHVSDYEKLNSLITKLNKSYDTQIEKIKQNYIDKPVYKLIERQEYGEQGSIFNTGLYSPLLSGKVYVKNKKK